MSLLFPWGVKGPDKSRFEAYAKLLRLKNGGQIKEASNFSEMPDEETEFDKPDDTDSVNANEFLLFDKRKLKRAFLDRLSELVANEKGGHHVSSSLMIEWPDRVDVLVKKALKGTIPPETRQKEVLSLNGRIASLLSHLEEFRALINDVISSPTQEGPEQVVKSAHDMFSLYKEHDFDEITGNNTNTRSLRDALGFLGKLQTCFNTLIRSAERLSGFQNLRILPVMDSPNGTDRPKRTDRNNAWSLKRTFPSLGLELNDKTVESIFGTSKNKGSAKRRLLERFEKLKSSASEVHAEIRVILAAAKHDCTSAAIFKYVGCSKRSCFLCDRFVQSYGSYTTRGCHGKLYHFWTVPEISWLAEEERSIFVRALKNVEKAMMESIHGRKTDKLAHARESTIGGSSVATKRQQSSQDPYVRSLVSEYLRSQRQGARHSHVNEEDYTSPNQPLPSGAECEANLDTLPGQTQSQSARIIPKPEQLQGECYTCERETSRRCEFCNLDWFCSRECQDKMRLSHLTKCSARSITTADRLCDDVIRDQFPDDPETREHFGLARCRDWREQSYLLGLYQGLVLYLHVEAIQLNEWREKNILVSEIIKTFSKLPEKNRGDYFRWFFRNQHILDNSNPPLQLNGKDNPVVRAVNAARPYLDPEDRVKPFQQLEPPSKRHCFLVYALALDSSHPNPYDGAEFDLWYDFGFVVCRDEWGEQGLGSLYSQLVGGNKFLTDYDQSLGTTIRNYPEKPTCSFNEFWLAYEKGSLANLFRRYGLGRMLDRDLGLEEFLSFPLAQRELRPSVWRLKHFLALDPNNPLSNFPKVEAAAQEYGFTSQLNAGTRLALRQFYEQLFKKVNPLRVHEAKNHGELCEYAESNIDVIDDGVRHVLQTLG
ncbi:uncharacterized protein TrAFT101_003913 [Trichoderma asperellum]|uniref:uncharacterized protein n=1 Tax=Trichoderma asperellum TaxID=101201 RepID=UPI0033271A60|nr:hypothetical protein TrAFT101_003913 [Trichoderma asperellum]